MHDQVRQPESKQLEGPKSVRELVAHIKPSGVLIQHFEMKPDVFRGVGLESLVIENITQENYLAALTRGGYVLCSSDRDAPPPVNRSDRCASSFGLAGIA